jgi:HTH-type transcriptional regulator/antitoxin HigA
MQNTAKTDGKRTSRLKFPEMPRDYAGLCALYLPRPIHDESELAAAIRMVDAMAAYDLPGEAAEYLEIVSQFIEEYEDSHVSKTPPLRGLDALNYLLEETGLDSAGLAEILGEQKAFVDGLFKGETELTVRHLRILADRFKVSPALFVDEG